MWHYNKKFKPNIVIGGGDYILSRHVSSKRAAKQLKKINKKFKKAKATRRYCIGNHDLNDLSKEQIKKTLGISYTYSVTDMNGFRIITLDTNDLRSGEDDYETTGRVPEEELDWLRNQLDVNLPVVVFSHHSPVRVGNDGSTRRNIYNDEQLRAILEERGNVVAVFSGHTPENYMTELNGIHYIVINNLTDKHAKKSYADIELKKSGNSVSVSAKQLGKDPENYSFSKEYSYR